MVTDGEHFDFLTGEAVDGEILTERLSRGSLSLEDALRYAIQVGNVLAATHELGEIHGYLSPACVALTSGDARVLRPQSDAADRPKYRAPELTRGEEPDSGADIFAFGVLLAEMLQSCGDAPAELNSLIRNLTAPNKVERRQRMQNAVIELRLIARRLRPAPGIPARRDPRPAAITAALRSARDSSRRVATVTIALIALAASAVAAVLLFDTRASTPTFKFTVAAPEQAVYPGGAALSADGTRVVFSAYRTDGTRTLWLRRLDALRAAAIPGTEGGAEPFWSADGRSIGFFAGGALKRTGLSGESPVTICSADALAGGGTWNAGGLILFAPGLAGGIYRIPEGGGAAQLLTPVDADNGERSIRWPQFLPDGRHFLFFKQTTATETTGVYAGRLDGAKPRMLLRTESNAVFTSLGASDGAGGYLLFLRQGNLVAQAVDLSRMTIEGEVATVANDVDRLASLSLIPVSASNNGVLAYQSVGTRTRQLAWMDRNGVQIGVLGEPGDYGAVRLSPDGARVAVKMHGSGEHPTQVRILSAETGLPAIGETPALPDTEQAFSPDGKLVAYTSNDSNVPEIYVQRLGGIRGIDSARVRISSGGGAQPRWSRDGRELLYMSADGSLMSCTAPDFRTPRALFATRHLAHVWNSFDVSPDGQKFLVNLPLEDASSSPITIVTNWAARLKR